MTPLTTSLLFQELVCLNQHLLNALGVGHPAIDNVCTLAKAQGLNAKLTGGGGGGCVIALLPFGKGTGLASDLIVIIGLSFQTFPMPS